MVLFIQGELIVQSIQPREQYFLKVQKLWERLVLSWVLCSVGYGIYSFIWNLGLVSHGEGRLNCASPHQMWEGIMKVFWNLNLDMFLDSIWKEQQDWGQDATRWALSDVCSTTQGNKPQKETRQLIKNKSTFISGNVSQMKHVLFLVKKS